MIYSIIVALSENNVMGRDGGLPWQISSDLKLFRMLTMGKPLIMGRKTFQTLPGPLDGRDNIVVSRDLNFDGQGIVQALTIESAYQAAETCAQMREVDEVMIIGGAEIYRLTLPKVNRIYLTRVHAQIDGDTLFPDVDWDSWKLVKEQRHDAGQRDEFDFSFRIYERNHS